MKAATTRQTKLEGSQRLVAGIFELIGSVNSNDGFGISPELNAKFLLDDGIARAERRGAGRGPIGGRGQRQREENGRASEASQNSKIVAREGGSRKKRLGRSCARNLAGQRALRPRTRLK